MAKPSKILRKAINRLRASGRTWQEIADELGFRNRGQAYMIATGGWAPKPDRLEEIMRELPRELWQTSKTLRDAMLIHLRTQHIGIKKAVKSRYLARQYCTTDRKVRAAIHELRNEGHPICSSVGKSSGFYWPASMREYKEFRFGDYGSRIKKMQKTLDMMDMAAEAMFEGRPLAVMEQRDLI